MDEFYHALKKTCRDAFQIAKTRHAQAYRAWRRSYNAQEPNNSFMQHFITVLNQLLPKEFHAEAKTYACFFIRGPEKNYRGLLGPAGGLFFEVVE